MPNKKLERKYKITAWLYDILDYPWERIYRHWRPFLVGDLHGTILEAGVGTGRNLPHYNPGANLLGIDLCDSMLHFAHKKGEKCRASFVLEKMDAANLSGLKDNSFDFYISTFMYCVMPDSIQPLALQEMARVLKPGGRFRILEIVFSKNRKKYRTQQLLAPFVRLVYGARFDRQTVQYIQAIKSLEISSLKFLKDDTYLMIEGEKVAEPHK